MELVDKVYFFIKFNYTLVFFYLSAFNNELI